MGWCVWEVYGTFLPKIIFSNYTDYKVFFSKVA